MLELSGLVYGEQRAVSPNKEEPMGDVPPRPGVVGTFRKSGSRVRVIRVCDERTYEGLLEVERTDTGKSMVIDPRSFEPESAWGERDADKSARLAGIKVAPRRCRSIE